MNISKKQAALIIILSGIFINILALPFIQHYNPQIDWIGNMGRIEVVLIQGTKIQEAPPAPGTKVSPSSNPEFAELGRKIGRELFPEDQNPSKYYTGRVAFSYRYVFLISVLLIFSGGILIILSPNRCG